MRYVLAFMLVAAGAGSGSAQEQLLESLPLPPSEHIFSDPACEGIQNTFRCSRAIERERIGHSHGLVERTETSLRLRLGSGDWMVLQDHEDRFMSSYSYLGYQPGLRYYVLHQQYPEGSAVRVIHRPSGWSKTIDDLPVVAPNRQFVAVAADGYFTRTAIVLYSVPQDTLVIEWETEPDDWAPVEAFWLGDHRFGVLREYMLACESDQAMPWHREYSDTVEVVRREDGGWVIEAPSAEEVPDSIASAARKCYQAPPF